MNKQKKAQAGTRTGCGMTARRRLRSSDGEDEIVHRDKHLCFLWRLDSRSAPQIRTLLFVLPETRPEPCRAVPCRAAVPGNLQQRSRGVIVLVGVVDQRRRFRHGTSSAALACVAHRPLQQRPGSHFVSCVYTVQWPLPRRCPAQMY